MEVIMKNILLTALCAILTHVSLAQISLDHTFPNGVKVTKINDTDYRFVTIDTGKYLVSIYNTDYTLDQTIKIKAPAGMHVAMGGALVRKNLYNNKYEVALGVITEGPNNSFTGSYYCIFNEDGTLLFQGPKYFIFASYFNLATGTKMVLVSDQSGSDSANIYSLSGHFFNSTRPIAGESITTQVFPNPSADHIIIAIKNLDKSATFDIQNINGQVIQQRQLSAGQKNIDIDTRDLPSGVYLYTINSGNSSETGKFLVAH